MAKARVEKRPVAGGLPSGEKIPRIGSEPPGYLSRKASWRVSRIHLADPYGWHELTLAEIGSLQSKLANFETMTWADIFEAGKKRNHQISVASLKCRDAQKWMERNMPDQPTLWTLRLSGAERIWGIFSEGAYQVIFWDPEHKIYPTIK